MHTILLRLAGPMQSWGTTSRFNQRDSGNEPSKSGVVGLVAAALGIDRGNWSDLEPVTRLRMGVRHDRPGLPGCDYQTAGCAATDTIIKADGVRTKEGVVSQRFYIADAAFLVGLSSGDRQLLERVYEALRDPVWPLSLGRKSYLPSDSIWLKDALLDAPLLEVLRQWPWITSRRGRTGCKGKGRETGETTAESKESSTVPGKGCAVARDQENSRRGGSGKPGQVVRIRYRKRRCGSGTVKTGGELTKIKFLSGLAHPPVGGEYVLFDCSETVSFQVHPRTAGKVLLVYSDTVSFQVHPRTAGNILGSLALGSLRRITGKYWHGLQHSPYSTLRSECLCF